MQGQILNEPKRDLFHFFGNDEDEMVRVAIARSTHNTTGNDNDGGGKPRAKRTTSSTGAGVMNLSQSSTGSSPEIVKIRKRNVRDSIRLRDKWDKSDCKTATTLTRHLTKPYDQVTRNQLEVICEMEDEYDAPEKAEILRGFIKDDMIL
jgi:hypothetical protein